MLLGEAGAYLVSGAVLYISISRLGGVELLGGYSLVMAWIMLFQLGALGTPEFVMREAASNPDEAEKCIRHGFLIAIGFSLLCIPIIAAAVLLFPYSAEVKQALLLATATILPSVALSLSRAIFLVRGRIMIVFLLACVDTTITVSLSLMTLTRGAGLTWLVGVMVVSKCVTGVIAVLFVVKQIRPISWSVDFAFIQAVLPSIVAFASSNALGLIAMRLNIIMLSIWGSTSEIGLYAGASKIMEVALVIPSMFAQLLLPNLARSGSLDRRIDSKQVLESLRLVCALTMPLGAGIILFSQPITGALYGPEFLPSVPTLRVLMVYFLFEAVDTVMGVVLKAAGRQNADVRIFLLNPLANGVLNLWLITMWGGIGAALAKLAGILCSASTRYVYISRRLFPFSLLQPMTKTVLVTAVLAFGVLMLRPFAHEAVLGVCYLSISALWLLLPGGALTGQFRRLTGLRRVVQGSKPTDPK